MSDLRVALIAEGPTDAIVIEAALKALLPRPFVLTHLQPEPTRPKLGTGWGGVLRWCLDFATRGHARFEDDPTLLGFDLFVVHIDADVAEKRYADVSDEIADLAGQRGWPTLPNVIQCPPPSGSADAMRTCLLAWAGMSYSPTIFQSALSIMDLYPRGGAFLNARDVAENSRIPGSGRAVHGAVEMLHRLHNLPLHATTIIRMAVDEDLRTYSHLRGEEADSLLTKLEEDLQTFQDRWEGWM